MRVEIMDYVGSGTTHEQLPVPVAEICGRTMLVPESSGFVWIYPTLRTSVHRTSCWKVILSSMCLALGIIETWSSSLVVQNDFAF